MIERAADPKAVSILLGHTDVSFTLNRYTHPDNEYLHEQMQLIETRPESSLQVSNKNELQLLLPSLIRAGAVTQAESNLQTVPLQLQIPLPTVTTAQKHQNI